MAKDIDAGDVERLEARVAALETVVAKLAARFRTCPMCNGSGSVSDPVTNAAGEDVYHQCPLCHGAPLLE